MEIVASACLAIVVSAGISLIASANLLRSQATGCDLYGFSSENWKRPAAEIDDLMGLFRLHLVNADSQAWQMISTI
jgi:undecaprenyl diphosphate synthase